MINLIIFLIILAIITFISFKIFKKIITTILSISIILAIFFIILIFLTYSDITNIQNNFQISNNLILLEDSQLLTGLTLNQQNNETKPLSEQELTSINPKNNNYYKTIIINPQFLYNNLGENVEIATNKLSEKINLTKQQIISILKSNNPINEFKTYTNNNILISETDKVKFKAQILTTSIKELQFKIILIEYKNKNLRVYPETISFKVIKVLPKSILNNIQ